MIGHMASIAIPRMTKPWSMVAAPMAVFGFVYGYVGTAGAPFCGSMGTCLQLVVDRGVAGFAPASLIPGAIGATFFAAVVYVLFLIIYGIRKASDRGPAASEGLAQSTQPSPAVRNGPKQWARPTPLLLATSAALAWAILSVGPASLAQDVGELIPRDTVTPSFCVDGWVPSGDGCFDDPATPNYAIYVPTLPGEEPVDFSRPQCLGYGFGARPESDGMCHERSGGTIEPLIGDLVRGGQNGLLAFLAVGAALLLLPRLRAASQPQG